MLGSFQGNRRPFLGGKKGGGNVQSRNAWPRWQQHGAGKGPAGGRGGGGGASSSGGGSGYTVGTVARPENVGCGLNNLGNTCYLNSILQVLTHCPNLTAKIEKAPHNKQCTAGQTSFCVLCELERHIIRARRSKQPIAPQRIVSNIRKISPHFSVGTQEDAHEFLRLLVDHMQRSCGVAPGNGSSKSGGGGASSSGAGAKVATPPATKPYPFHIFAGALQSLVRCDVCKAESHTVDPIEDLDLEIDRPGINCVRDALHHFTRREVLDGANKYACEKCKTHVRASKEVRLLKVAPVLVLQLKHFQFHHIGLSASKICKRIDFDMELDMTPFMTSKLQKTGETVKCELFALVVHMGPSVHSGHYYSYVKAGPARAGGCGSQWYRMDDSDVQLVSASTVLKASPYMLFYRSTRTPGQATPSGLVPPPSLAVPPLKLKRPPEEAAYSAQPAAKRPSLAIASAPPSLAATPAQALQGWGKGVPFPGKATSPGAAAGTGASGVAGAAAAAAAAAGSQKSIDGGVTEFIGPALPPGFVRANAGEESGGGEGGAGGIRGSGSSTGIGTTAEDFIGPQMPPQQRASQLASAAKAPSAAAAVGTALPGPRRPVSIVLKKPKSSASPSSAGSLLPSASAGAKREEGARQHSGSSSTGGYGAGAVRGGKDEDSLRGSSAAAAAAAVDGVSGAVDPAEQQREMIGKEAQAAFAVYMDELRAGATTAATATATGICSGLGADVAAAVSGGPEALQLQLERQCAAFPEAEVAAWLRGRLIAVLKRKQQGS